MYKVKIVLVVCCVRVQTIMTAFVGFFGNFIGSGRDCSYMNGFNGNRSSKNPSLNASDTPYALRMSVFMLQIGPLDHA